MAMTSSEPPILVLGPSPSTQERKSSEHKRHKETGKEDAQGTVSQVSQQPGDQQDV
jgi:hypothetical protein